MSHTRICSEVRSDSVLIEKLPHIPQNDSWDCGLACLEMVTRYLKPVPLESEIVEACQKHNLGKSVWTIDLAYLCCILDIPHLFCTQTLGVDSNYANESFYVNEMQSDLHDEERRINSLFLEAEKNGVNVERKSVDISDILKHLELKQPIIVLVNDHKLRNYQTRCSDIPDTPQQASCCAWLCCLSFMGHSSCESQQLTTENDHLSSEYWGHYVVIVGYDLCRKIFILNDPCQNGKHVECDFEALEDARKSYGTDEDILFIYSSKS